MIVKANDAAIRIVHLNAAIDYFSQQGGSDQIVSSLQEEVASLEAEIQSEFEHQSADETIARPIAPNI